jgi:glycosyltransferase involved in cell wall biosynthesis
MKSARVIRVLQLLTTTALGGGPRQVFHLVRHLPAAEFEVSVGGPCDERFAGDLRALGLELAEVAADSLRAFPLTLRRVGRLIRDARADVVHTHGKGAGLYGRLAARLAGVPSVHTFHGIHYERYSRAGQTAYLALERWLAGFTHTVINVSRTQEAEALRLGVARPGRSAVVLNGIDVDELDARPASRRADLGLSADDEVVACVARFDPIKRHEALVRTLAIVAKRHPRAALFLAGDGPEKLRIERLAHDLKVRVVSPGVIGQEKNPYSSCDLYVTVSSKEGLPLAPLEAMASGLAVIATNVPGHRDVVEDGTTGLLVPAEDDARLAAAIESLLDDPERRRRMGQAGRARVLREFTLQSMIAKTAAVYRAAADSRKG